MVVKRTVVKLVAAAVLGLFAVPLAVEAQQATKVWRIGVLAAEGVLESNPFDALLGELRDLGYLEGRNISIEYRRSVGGSERYATLAGELVGLKVDIIITLGTPATLAAKAATTTIPIVVASAGDLVGTGIITSLAHPGGNVTGLTLQSPELTGKRLEVLREAVPGAAVVVVLINRKNPLHVLIWKESQAAAAAVHMKLREIAVGTLDELEATFAAGIGKDAGAIIVPLDPMFNGQRRRIAALAAKNGLPTMGGDKIFVEAGGLIAYGPSYRDLFRRAAHYVDRIFRGAKPANMPVEQPTKFELTINLKTARALGLTIPPSLLLRADQIIE
jgi:putative tryptophan/tyrosine transport system substrate-binding protein